MKKYNKMREHSIPPLEANKPEHIEIKMVILGFESTGKNTFSIKLTSKSDKDFNQRLSKNILTIGAKYRRINIKFEKKTFLVHICITPGHESFYSQFNLYINQSNIILIFYDPLNRYSFDKIKYFMELIKNIIPSSENLVIAIVRSKYELNIDKNNSKNIVSDEEALEYADKNNLLFFHLSIFEKYETGIKELINSVLKYYNKILQNNN